MSDDVVVELDAWIAYGGIMRIDQHQAQRVRDEIVALRAKCIELSADRTRRLVADRRAKVLEEAARVCDALYDGYSTASTDQTDPEQVWLDACDRAATRIRALKEKRDE